MARKEKEEKTKSRPNAENGYGITSAYKTAQKISLHAKEKISHMITLKNHN